MSLHPTGERTTKNFTVRERCKTRSITIKPATETKMGLTKSVDPRFKLVEPGPRGGGIGSFSSGGVGVRPDPDSQDQGKEEDHEQERELGGSHGRGRGGDHRGKVCCMESAVFYYEVVSSSKTENSSLFLFASLMSVVSLSHYKYSFILHLKRLVPNVGAPRLANFLAFCTVNFWHISQK